MFLVPTTNGNVNTNLLNPSALSHLFSNGSSQLLQTLPQLLNNPHATSQPSLLNSLTQPVPSLLPTPSTLLTTQSTPSSTPPLHRNHHINQMNHQQLMDSKLHQIPTSRNNASPASSCTNRDVSTNGEISLQSHGNNSSHTLKRPPSSLSISSNCDNSTADLLIDSPSELSYFS